MTEKLVPRRGPCHHVYMNMARPGKFPGRKEFGLHMVIMVQPHRECARGQSADRLVAGKSCPSVPTTRQSADVLSAVVKCED